MKYIASVSFGKDSLAMLLKLLELSYPLDYVVFYDTGMEFEPIYNLEKKVEKILKGVEYIRLQGKSSFEHYMFEHVKRCGEVGYSWCGGMCRWETTHKVQAINNFKKSLGCKAVDYIGIAADEPDRIKEGVYPLVELGMTEQDCLDYCRQQGYNWEIETTEGVKCLYELLDRVSCWCCANKNLKELRNIYRYLPFYWRQLKGLQARTSRLYKGVGVDALDARFKREGKQLYLFE